MLREDLLPDYGLSVAGLAEAAGVSRQSVNELLRGRRAASPEVARRLARFFGNTPEFWMNALLPGAYGTHLQSRNRAALWRHRRKCHAELGHCQCARHSAPAR